VALIFHNERQIHYPYHTGAFRLCGFAHRDDWDVPNDPFAEARDDDHVAGLQRLRPRAEADVHDVTRLGIAEYRVSVNPQIWLIISATVLEVGSEVALATGRAKSVMCAIEAACVPG
jgi:hypothetical protein